MSLLTGTGVRLALPLVLGVGLFDKILVEKGDLQLLNLIILAILGAYLVNGVLHYAQTYLLAYVGQRVIVDLRNSVFDQLQRLSLAFHERRRSGDIISRVTGDMGLVQAALTTGVADFIRDVATLAGILGMAVYIHWRLAAVSFAIFPVAAVAVGVYGRRIRTFTRQVQERLGAVTAVLQESLLGIRVVKAFNMEEYEKRRFAGHNEQSFAAAMKSTRIVATAAPVVELLLISGMTAVVWFGAREVVEARLSPGELVAFLTYAGMAAGPVAGITRTYGVFQQAFAAADRIFELLDMAPDLEEPGNAVHLGAVRGEVAFRGVSFAYEPGNWVLREIDLVARPGEVIALVGPSGAGKTTMVNLIPRFYDPTEGCVEVDGHDLREVSVTSLRRQIGLVPQESVLFGVPVAENVAYGKPEATMDEIVAAAKAANAHDFIAELPSGYLSLLSEGGGNLSGGQRQRIAIARAILRDPKILILDEATSALDTESEALVQEALARLMWGRTTFIIAHRLSTVMAAHRILVLEQGRVVEEGGHDDLLARRGAYRRLFEAQFRGKVSPHRRAVAVGDGSG
ncbi:MAG: ABC transporter ATP-binding protein [Firmicutes bacterium]|nr:ABC transporter ATP-binding protein [Bacillota bacterium]